MTAWLSLFPYGYKVDNPRK